VGRISHSSVSRQVDAQPRISAFLLALECARAQTLSQFDVASVKHTRDDSGKWIIAIPPGGRFSATVISPTLIMNAFSIIPAQLSGGPTWIDSERFDIEARTAGPDQITHDRMGPLLQSLLADRFGLKYHRETREARGYSLIVAKGGPKLATNTGHQIGIETGRGQVKEYNEPLAALAHEHAILLDDFIVDETSVAGDFDFTLKWAYNDDPASNLPSILSALQKQSRRSSAENSVNLCTLQASLVCHSSKRLWRDVGSCTPAKKESSREYAYSHPPCLTMDQSGPAMASCHTSASSQ
jgi:uncharacterized protein (TIGR03435 family)